MKNSSKFLLSFALILFLVSSCNQTAVPTATPAPLPTLPPITDSISLVVPSYPDGSQVYYIELLEESLAAIGYRLELETVGPLSQPEAVAMLDSGEISLMHLVGSEERNEKYVQVPVGLTNALIANRILLVPNGEADAYADVETLDDFRVMNKVGAFGDGWFDVAVWEANQLPYHAVEGEWRVIYDELADPDSNIDYFSRGFTEIAADAETHPNLDVEQHLVLIYERDFYFYLSESGAEHAEVLTRALENAKESSLMDRLIRRYWEIDFEWLNFDSRTKIYLETPQ